MKSSALNSLRFAAGLILASSASIFAQTATTDPVGFITLNVKASGGTGTEQLSFKALGLTQAVAYQGSSEAFGATRDIVVDNEATWTDSQFNGANGEYYLEIVSGPAAGTTYDILATTDSNNSVTLSQSVPASIGGNPVVSGFSFKIRKHWTIGSVFGPANEAGLGAGALGEADDILIFNPASGQFDTYYYRIGGIGGSGWRKANTGELATNQKIYPDDGVIIRRRQGSDVNVVLMGAVKTGSTSTPIVSGLNFVGNVYAANMTLGSSNLYTGDANTGLAGGALGEADDVLIYDPTTKGYKSYFYRIGGIGGSGWRSADDGSIATDVPIPVGSSVVVRRRGANGFNWVAPQHPASI